MSSHRRFEMNRIEFIIVLRKIDNSLKSNVIFIS